MANKQLLSQSTKPTVDRRSTAVPILPIAYFEEHRLPAGEDEKLVSDSAVLRISTALQSSLHSKDVIQTFAAEVRDHFPQVSVRYRNPTAELSIDDGPAQFHQCNYELNLVGDSLGEITFLRQRAFAEREQAILEILLCALIYPLRNAILYQQALEQALKDPLTGVNNRASLDAYLKQQANVTQRHRTPLSVIMLDIDRFKNINDTYGHLVGDKVLRCVADAIVRCTRDSDVVFRFGGEEFVVVLSNTEHSGAYYLAERIRKHIENLDNNVIGDVNPITVSVGVAELEEDMTPTLLLEACDKLLYQAKRRGRNRVETNTKHCASSIEISSDS